MKCRARPGSSKAWPSRRSATAVKSAQPGWSSRPIGGVAPAFKHEEVRPDLPPVCAGRPPRPQGVGRRHGDAETVSDACEHALLSAPRLSPWPLVHQGLDETEAQASAAAGHYDRLVPEAHFCALGVSPLRTIGLLEPRTFEDAERVIGRNRAPPSVLEVQSLPTPFPAAASQPRAQDSIAPANRIAMSADPKPRALSEHGRPQNPAGSARRRPRLGSCARRNSGIHGGLSSAEESRDAVRPSQAEHLRHARLRLVAKTEPTTNFYSWRPPKT